MTSPDVAAIVDELTPTPLTPEQQTTARLAFDHALQGRLRLVQYRVHELADRSLHDVAEAAGWLIDYIRDEQKQRAQQAPAEAILTPDADGADERSSSPNAVSCHSVRGWDPTDIVTTVELPYPDEASEGFTAVVRGTVPGPVILVPTVALTPVDTTPAEPEPGAWDLDGIIAVCVEVDDWRIPSREQPGPEGWAIYRFTWRTVWEMLGGPGITPRRLVPEPEPVELPWSHTDGRGVVCYVDVIGDAHGGAEVGIRVNGNVIYAMVDAAEMAAALLSIGPLQ